MLISQSCGRALSLSTPMLMFLPVMALSLWTARLRSDDAPHTGGETYPCGTGKAATAWCNTPSVRRHGDRTVPSPPTAFQCALLTDGYALWLTRTVPSPPTAYISVRSSHRRLCPMAHTHTALSSHCIHHSALFSSTIAALCVCTAGARGTAHASRGLLSSAVGAAGRRRDGVHHIHGVFV
jgi:hypothetical protein